MLASRSLIAAIAVASLFHSRDSLAQGAWTNADVGSVGLAGSGSQVNGVWTARGAGADIWGTADAFHFVHQPLTGDGSLTVRVDALQHTSPFAKAGVMLRADLSAGAAHVLLSIRPTGDLEFMQRTAQGANTTFIATASTPPPYWLRLTRSASTVAASIATDGVTWTSVGSVSTALPATVEAGLIVTSHDTSQLNTATFEGLSALPSAWSNQDIGAVSLTGNAAFDGGTFTVGGGGPSGVWGTADGFHFVHQPFSGDGSLVVQVTTMGNTDTFAKVGIMLRDGIGAGAANVILSIRPTNDVEFMQRATAGGETVFYATATAPPPSWLRLSRSGSTISGAVSPDGTAWNAIGSVTAAMPTTIQAGLVVTSVNASQLDVATFDNVSAVASSVPTSYNAIDDDNIRTKPAPPSLPPHGGSFVDPTFGTTIVRVTDASLVIDANSSGGSYRTPSASPQRAWNANSTRFYVVGTGGNVVPVELNAATSTVTVSPSSLRFYGEAAFSAVDSDVIYGQFNDLTHVTVSAYNFATNSYREVLNTARLLPGTDDGNHFLGGVASGATNGVEYFTVAFGGGGQDTHDHVAWFPVASPSSAYVVDTVHSTLSKPSGTGSTNIQSIDPPLDFHLHVVNVDTSGRYVVLGSTSTDITQRGRPPLFVWDTATDSFTAVTNEPGGHGVPGFAVYVNMPDDTDAMQTLLRSLATPNTIAYQLVTPLPQPPDFRVASHANWNNAQPNALVPIVVGMYRYDHNDGPWRPWDEEILAMRTDGVASHLWRFAHHRSDVSCLAPVTTHYCSCATDVDPFWYTPRPNVSPDGRWVAFTSNWERTLGTDPAIQFGTCDNGSGPVFSSGHSQRQDVLLLKLVPQ